MNLGKQIDSLLKRYSSVYIRGLGVFQKVRTPATFDSKRNVFLPPISYIEFDHFTTEGYDYIAYLQHVEQIERHEAEARLNTVVTEIIDDIQQEGEYILDNLGSLVSYGNSFVFKPLDLSGFLQEPIKDDYYQGGVIEEEQPASEEIIEQDEIIVPNTTAVDQLVEATADIDGEKDISIVEETMQTSVVQQQEEPQQQDEKVVVAIEPKEGSSYIYGVIAAIAILALGGIYYYVTLKPEKTLVEHKVTVQSFPVDTNTSNIDTMSLMTLDTVDHDVISQDSIKNATVNTVLEDHVVDYKYAIVIGTHKSLEQANEEAKSYNKKGHKSVKVLEPNMSKNLKRVVWDTYPTREKRDSALRVVRKLYKADAWGTEI